MHLIRSSASTCVKVKEVDLYSAFIEVPYTQGAVNCTDDIFPCHLGWRYSQPHKTISSPRWVIVPNCIQHAFTSNTESHLYFICSLV